MKRSKQKASPRYHIWQENANQSPKAKATFAIVGWVAGWNMVSNIFSFSSTLMNHQ